MSAEPISATLKAYVRGDPVRMSLSGKLVRGRQGRGIRPEEHNLPLVPAAELLGSP